MSENDDKYPSLFVKVQLSLNDMFCQPNRYVLVKHSTITILEIYFLSLDSHDVFPIQHIMV